MNHNLNDHVFLVEAQIKERSANQSAWSKINQVRQISYGPHLMAHMI